MNQTNKIWAQTQLRSKMQFALHSCSTYKQLTNVVFLLLDAEQGRLAHMGLTVRVCVCVCVCVCARANVSLDHHKEDVFRM